MPFFIKFSQKQSNSRWSSIAISSNKLTEIILLILRYIFLKLPILTNAYWTLAVLDVGDTIFFQAFMNISFVGLFHGGSFPDCILLSTLIS